MRLIRSLTAAALVGCSLAPIAADAQAIDAASAPAGVYALDHAHASVTMKVSHLGLSYATLRFTGVDGSLTYDPGHPEKSAASVTIDASSVDAGDPVASRTVASDVLEAGRFPEIRFVSTAVRPDLEGRGEIAGDLTFHGVTRPVVLDTVFNGAARDGQAARLGFSGNTTIRRSDFGVGKDLPMMADEVSVDIEVEFKK